MQKNILLVYPKIPRDSYWSFSNSLSFIGKKALMPPLGLITIAGMLENYNLKLIDENVEKLKDKDLKWADLVFTSSMMIQSESLEQIVSRVKQLDKIVVAGGPYPTQYYNRIKNIDHFVLGESESGVLEQFLHDLERGNAKKAYAKFTLRKNGKGSIIDKNEFLRMKDYFGSDGDIEEVPKRPDINSSPIPKYDLVKIKNYELMALQFSRGCPFNCEFCNEPYLFGRIPRLKSKERFVEELDILYELGYTGPIFIVDDNFIGNIKEVKELLPVVEKFQKNRNYPFTFSTEATINLSKDDNLLKAMRNAGFDMVFVGIESTDDNVFKKAGKYINLETNFLEGIKKIQEYGMKVTAGFIIGMDKEPDDICDKIFNLCQEAGIPTAMTGLLTTTLGSELHDRLKEEGRLLKTFTSGTNIHFNLDYTPDRSRNPNEILSNYKSLLSRLYDYYDGKNYFGRCRELLNNFKPNWDFRSLRKAKLNEILGFAYSFIIQSFEPYGKEYRKFLLDTLRDKTELFPDAARLSMMGYHLFKITKDALK